MSDVISIPELYAQHILSSLDRLQQRHMGTIALIIPGDAATVASCGAGEQSPANGAVAGRDLTSDRRGIASGDAEPQTELNPLSGVHTRETLMIRLGWRCKIVPRTGEGHNGLLAGVLSADHNDPFSTVSTSQQDVQIADFCKDTFPQEYSLSLHTRAFEAPTDGNAPQHAAQPREPMRFSSNTQAALLHQRGSSETTPVLHGAVLNMVRRSLNEPVREDILASALSAFFTKVIIVLSNPSGLQIATQYYGLQSMAAHGTYDVQCVVLLKVAETAGGGMYRYLPIGRLDEQHRFICDLPACSEPLIQALLWDAIDRPSATDSSMVGFEQPFARYARDFLQHSQNFQRVRAQTRASHELPSVSTSAVHVAKQRTTPQRQPSSTLDPVRIISM